MALAEAPTTAAVERASASSIYTAMRILPRAQRAAMFEIYAFCRQVDDIADSTEPRAIRREQLQNWRVDINSLYAGKPVSRTQGLVAPVAAFGLRREDFHAVIDGMEMDVVTDIRAPDEATLDLYCDRVASAVGRLSVRVFGMEEQEGLALAHHLGRALQLTNILRDLDEDAAIGRLYLPAQGLLRAGITSTDPASVLASPTLGTVCAAVVDHHVEDRIVIRTATPAGLTSSLMQDDACSALTKPYRRGEPSQPGADHMDGRCHQTKACRMMIQMSRPRGR